MNTTAPVDASTAGDTVEVERSAGPSRYQIFMLGALQRKPAIYQGTADRRAVARRRARNKVAGQSRRTNREYAS